MRFKIIDRDGKAIELTVLDQQACSLFGIPVHGENYASPHGNKISSWFNVIGLPLAIMKPGPHDWSEIVGAIYGETILQGTLGKDTSFFEPYLMLIRHWKSMGYVPVAMQE